MTTRLRLAPIFVFLLAVVACNSTSGSLTPGGSQQQFVARPWTTAPISPGVTVVTLGNGNPKYSGQVFDLRVGTDGGLYYSLDPLGLASPTPGNGTIGRYDFATQKQQYALTPYQPGFLEQTSTGVWVAEAADPSGKVIVDHYKSIGGTNKPIDLPIGPFKGQLFSGLGGGTAIGSDGRIWFGSSNSPQLVALDQSTGSPEVYNLPIPSNGATPQPQYMAAGPDKSLWVSDDNNDSVWRVTTAGKATVTVLPQGNPFAKSPYQLTQGIGIGTDNKLYAASMGIEAKTYAQYGGSFNAGAPALSPKFASIKVPPVSSPYVVASAGGKVYFNDIGIDGLGIYDIASGKVVVLPLSPLAFGGIAVDPQGNPWVACLELTPTTGPKHVACIERVVLTSTWELYPSTNFSVVSGSSVAVGVGETGNSGPFTASSSDLCKIAPIAGFDHDFLLTPVISSGTCEISVKDAHGRQVSAKVTVTKPAAGDPRPRLPFH
ncbi:MAG: hypothetical protein JO199_04860 [Candidatus Eremiobacteraeota bacterium]|nr:hypothetical protein [Candidatus Eremiobacteraeota bacterium]